MELQNLISKEVTANEECCGPCKDLQSKYATCAEQLTLDDEAINGWPRHTQNVG